MSRKIKIGIIGAGTIGSVHADAYAKVANAEVVALCDILPNILAEKAKRHNIPLKYENYKDRNKPVEGLNLCRTCTHLSPSMLRCRQKRHARKADVLNADQARKTSSP